MLQTLQSDEVQCVYDYEVEAAGIGRRRLAELGSVPKELDEQYSWMFFADFHYLIDYMENGRGGPESFERFLRREPVPRRLIEPDPRPLVDLRRAPPHEISVAVLEGPARQVGALTFRAANGEPMLLSNCQFRRETKRRALPPHSTFLSRHHEAVPN